MRQQIAHVALLVADYDEAIVFYTEKLPFGVVEDTYRPAQDKRSVVIAPYGTAAVFVDLYGTKWDLIQFGGVSSTDSAAVSHQTRS